MISPKTMVKNSSVQGHGLFAQAPIAKGEIVWRFSERSCLLISKLQLQTFSLSLDSKNLMHYFLTYGFYVHQYKSLVLCLDSGRFVNHSFNPNCGCLADDTHQIADYSMALRDIEEGEELTEDYTSFDSVPWLQDFYDRYQIFQPQQPKNVPHS